MNVNQFETAVRWLSLPNKTKVLLLCGPCASGKTTLAFKLLEKHVIREFSGFDCNIPRELKLIKNQLYTKTVAEYAGVTYGPRMSAIIIEDVEFCDINNLKAIIAFAPVLPVVCISGDSKPPDPCLTMSSVQVRLFRPTVKVGTELLSSYGSTKVVSKVLESCNCDLRQAKIELELSSPQSTMMVVDKTLPNAFDSMPLLFPYKSLDQSLKIMQNDPLISMMVAENYLKTKELNVTDMATAAEDISTSDILHQVPEVSSIFSVISVPKNVRKGLSIRACYPSVISRRAVEFANYRKMPVGVNYTTINAIEKRIVRTLERGLSADIVAKEMKSMNLDRIDQWDAIKSLAAVGRDMIKIHPSKREQLRKCLFVYLFVNTDYGANRIT